IIIVSKNSILNNYDGSVLTPGQPPLTEIIQLSTTPDISGKPITSIPNVEPPVGGSEGENTVEDGIYSNFKSLRSAVGHYLFNTGYGSLIQYYVEILDKRYGPFLPEEIKNYIKDLVKKYPELNLKLYVIKSFSHLNKANISEVIYGISRVKTAFQLMQQKERNKYRPELDTNLNNIVAHKPTLKPTLNVPNV
ncbi:MAG: hypothetical protein WC436_05425, partial [Candidatus Babeliales bacterium]